MVAKSPEAIERQRARALARYHRLKDRKGFRKKHAAANRKYYASLSGDELEAFKERRRLYRKRPEVMAKDREYHRRVERDKAKRTAQQRRYRARLRNNAKLRASGDTHIFGVT